MNIVLNEIKIEISKKYLTGNYTLSSLGREYLIPYYQVRKILKEMSVSMVYDKSECIRKYTLNQHYFDTVDTEEKAYFLGLLYSDGYNGIDRNRICISLQEPDKGILDKFRFAIETFKPLRFIKGKNENCKNMYSMEISSKHMSKRLEELGCVQAKSLILKFPTKEQVPAHLLQHFIRGYFDGDGCFCVYKPKSRENKRYTICIVSAETFCASLKKYLFENANISSFVYKEKNNRLSARLIINGQQTRIFLNWLYKNSTIYLERKYQKFIFEYNI